jgi:hypothetical protein
MAIAAAATLATSGLTAASAASVAPGVPQAVRVAPQATRSAITNPGDRLWAKRYDGTGHNADAATAVAVSPDGATVYVTGESYGPTSVPDYATVAYNAATGDRRWVSRYAGPAGSLSNAPTSVAASPDGRSVFVTGKTLVGQFGDYATVAYDAASGNQLWVRRYNGPGNNDDGATAMAVSPTSATVYVTGFSWGNGTGTDYATVAYNAMTGSQQWVKRYNGPPGTGNDNANSMTIGPTGTVYVTGGSWGGTSGDDYATVAYDAAGNRLWVKRYTFPGGNSDDAESVAVSPDGKTVYVTGQSWGGQAAGWDYATLAYDAVTGTQHWAKRYNGPGSATDTARSVAVSPDNRTVYVTGQSEGLSTGADYATIAYAADGTPEWAQRYNDAGNGDDTLASLVVNSVSGTVYVTGKSAAPSGLYDYATVAYTAAGIQQWVQRPVGTVLYPSAITVSPITGTVFVTGTNTGDYTTVAYQG